MTPAARLAAAIEILEEIERAPAPADAAFAAYTKARRFIGSKDRAAVADLVYGVFRRRARLDWRLARAGIEPGPRARVVADQLLAGGRDVAELRALFSELAYAPAPLSDAEAALAQRLSGEPLEHPAMPEAVCLECPAWAEPGLRAAFGERFAEEMVALGAPAPVDLRVNPLKATRDEAAAALAAAGIVARPTPLSPWGLRLDGRPPLSAIPAFRDGLVEVQDEGSQLVALAVDARPGMQVVDFCAGAGGKALAIAAAMRDTGRVVACDVSAERLERAVPRLRRAGVRIVERRPLAGARDPWLGRHAGRFDRVLVDAPCSGTGTWRRNPDARWGRGGPASEELVALQARILARAAGLVRPGGRLVYATCSLLPGENEEQVEAFLARRPEFGEAELPHPLPGSGGRLRLTPARHGTDGFFIAALERIA